MVTRIHVASKKFAYFGMEFETNVAFRPVVDKSNCGIHFKLHFKVS